MNNINRTNSPKMEAIELTRLLTRLPMDPQYLKTPKKKHIKVKSKIWQTILQALHCCNAFSFAILSKVR